METDQKKKHEVLIVLASEKEDFQTYPNFLLKHFGSPQYHQYKSIEETFENLPNRPVHLSLVDGRGGTAMASEWCQAIKMAHPESAVWVLYGTESPLDFSVLKKNGANQVFHLLFDHEFFVSTALEVFAEEMVSNEPPLAALESISSDDVDTDSEINFDLYIHLGSSKKSVLIRKKGSVIDDRLKKNAEKSNQTLFVKKTEMKQFFEYARTVKSAANLDAPVTLTEKFHRTKKMFYNMMSNFLDADAADFQKGKAILAVYDQIIGELGLRGPFTVQEARSLMENFSGQQKSTYQDALNICAFATLLGWIIELPAEKIRSLSMASLFHNIGLSQLPISTFGKSPKDYDAAELESYKHYPEKSVNMVKTKKVPLDVSATDAIMEHCENADGSGFPKGKLATDTDDLAKLLHLACRIHELTGALENHIPLSFPQALEELQRDSLSGSSQKHDLTLVSTVLKKLA